MAEKVVVDAGCGPGGFIDIERPHAATVVGFDLSEAIATSYESHGKYPNVYLCKAISSVVQFADKLSIGCTY